MGEYCDAYERMPSMRESSQPGGCPHTGTRQQEYDMNHRNEESISFYHSDQWKRMQALVKMACHGLDMYAFYAEHQ